MQWSTSTPYKTTRFHWTINHSKFAHYSGHGEHPSAVFYLTKMKLKAVWIEWKQQGPFSRTISECTIFFDATYFWKKSTTFQNTFTIKTLNMARNYSYNNKPPKLTSKFIFLKSIMLNPILLHFSQVPWRPNFVQNGDPMGTQIWARWGSSPVQMGTQKVILWKFI